VGQSTWRWRLLCSPRSTFMCVEKCKAKLRPCLHSDGVDARCQSVFFRAGKLEDLSLSKRVWFEDSVRWKMDVPWCVSKGTCKFTTLYHAMINFSRRSWCMVFSNLRHAILRTKQNKVVNN
jgi:hypothetical protein